jgi:hypothetical protein
MNFSIGKFPFEQDPRMNKIMISAVTAQLLTEEGGASYWNDVHTYYGMYLKVAYVKGPPPWSLMSASNAIWIFHGRLM